MKIHPMPAFLLAAALALGAASLPAQAQAPAAGGASASRIEMPKQFTQGEVRKLDKAAGTITIKHGEIKNLGMPPMAMVFEARDPRLLDKLKPGDKVRFKAVHQAGKYVLVDLKRAR